MVNLTPSLSIFKPSLNSMVSIFNRIFGAVLLVYSLVFLVNILLINFNEINIYGYPFWGNFLGVNSGIFFTKKNYIILFLSIIFCFLFCYHLVFSNLKIMMKYNKYFQLVSKDLNIINKIYIRHFIYTLLLTIFLIYIIYVDSSYLNIFSFYNYNIFYISSNILYSLIVNFIEIFFKVIILFQFLLLIWDEILWRINKVYKKVVFLYNNNNFFFFLNYYYYKLPILILFFLVLNIINKLII